MSILKKAILAAAFVSVVLVGAQYAKVAADDDSSIPPASDAQLAAINQNCSEIKTTLQQLDDNDVLMRINQGQLYEEVGSNLMAPMNSRIALNRYDGAELVKTTANYTDTFTEFQNNYKVYGAALQKVLSNDCKDANSFYEQLMAARQARLKLSSTVKKLNNIIKQYRKQFSTFAESLPEQDGGQ